MYSVYILQNQVGKHYIGYTAQPIKERVVDHNHGKCQSTRSKGPWKIKYVEEYATKAEAYRRERQIKKYKGGRAFKKLLNIE